MPGLSRASAATVAQAVVCRGDTDAGRITVFGSQVALLELGLLGLGLSGLVLDVIRLKLEPAADAPRWPSGGTSVFDKLQGQLSLFRSERLGVDHHRSASTTIRR